MSSPHVRLGGRGQAQQRRYRPWSGLLADEAAHVAVVGTEVVAPAREAVGLVQHPAADLALVERPAQGAAAKLLRRDQEDACAAEAHPLQRLGPLGHGEHPVDGHAALDPMPLQSRHLVRHQRDERRDHHRQRAGLVVAGERGNLVAERLAGAGGQDAERVPARHRLFDDGLLRGAAVGFRRFRPEVIDAGEPALHLLAGVVPLPAPVAGGIGAGGVPEPAHEAPGLGKLVAHPGGHDRIAARDREPGQRIGQRPAGIGRIRHGGTRVSGAGGAFQSSADRPVGLGVGGPGRAAQHPRRIGRERDPRRRAPAWLASARQQAGWTRSCPQRLPLLTEDLQR